MGDPDSGWQVAGDTISGRASGEQRATRSTVSRISRGRLVSAAAGATVTLVALWLALITAAAATIRKKNVSPDAPGTRDSLDAPWQRTYCSLHKTRRQCEFGRSSPQHHAPGRSSPRHLLTGRSVAGHFRSGRTVSGHFPSGRSRVRAFSF